VQFAVDGAESLVGPAMFGVPVDAATPLGVEFFQVFSTAFGPSIRRC